MHRIDDSSSQSAALAFDPPGPPGTTGHFRRPNPGGGIEGTIVTPDWAEDVQETLAHPIEAAGITLGKGDFTQLTAAINALIASALAPSFKGKLIGRLERVDGANARLTRGFEGNVYVDADGNFLSQATDLGFDMAADIDGSETADTFYYLYVEPTGGPPVDTLTPHISATPPLLAPSGGKLYYHPTNPTWRCIGSVYNDSAQDLVHFDVVEGHYRETFLRNRDTFPVIQPGTAVIATYNAINLAGLVPATAVAVKIAVETNMASGNPGASLYYGLGVEAGLTFAAKGAGVYSLRHATSDQATPSGIFTIPVVGAAPSISYCLQGVSVSQHDVYVVGWVEQLGSQ